MCQSVRASGPICTPLSLSLSLFFALPPSLSVSLYPCSSLYPARSLPVSATICSSSSSSSSTVTITTPGGKCTDTTDRTGSAPPSPSPPSPPPHFPLLVFGAFFFFFFVFFFFFPGVHTGFDSQHRSQFRLWIIIPPHRPEKVGFVRCKGLCVVFWRVCFNFDFIGDVCWVCLFFVVFLIIIIIILRRTCSHTSCRHRNKDKKEKEKKKLKTQMCCGQNPQFSHSVDLGQFSAWHGFSRWVQHPPNHPPPLPISAHPPTPPAVGSGGWPLLLQFVDAQTFRSLSISLLFEPDRCHAPLAQYFCVAFLLVIRLFPRGFRVVPETKSPRLAAQPLEPLWKRLSIAPCAKCPTEHASSCC